MHLLSIACLWILSWLCAWHRWHAGKYRCSAEKETSLLNLCCQLQMIYHSCYNIYGRRSTFNRWHCFPGLGLSTVLTAAQLSPFLSLSLTSPGSLELFCLEPTSLKCWTDSWPKHTWSHFKQYQPLNQKHRCTHCIKIYNWGLDNSFGWDGWSWSHTHTQNESYIKIKEIYRQ